MPEPVWWQKPARAGTILQKWSTGMLPISRQRQVTTVWRHSACPPPIRCSIVIRVNAQFLFLTRRDRSLSICTKHVMNQRLADDACYRWKQLSKSWFILLFDLHHELIGFYIVCWVSSTTCGVSNASNLRRPGDSAFAIP